MLDMNIYCNNLYLAYDNQAVADTVKLNLQNISKIDVIDNNSRKTYAEGVNENVHQNTVIED